MSEFLGFHTIYGVDGEHDGPYMTRFWIGRLRLHIFHRGDNDPDCHDHPWGFWTFPLTPYVEEVVEPDPTTYLSTFRTFYRVVPAFRWSYRPATHTPRVIGRASQYALGLQHYQTGVIDPGFVGTFLLTDNRKIVTIVWRGRGERKWGFLRNRDGNWCWTPWREYIFGGGKHAPCEPDNTGDL